MAQASRHIAWAVPSPSDPTGAIPEQQITPREGCAAFPNGGQKPKLERMGQNSQTMILDTSVPWSRKIWIMLEEPDAHPVAGGAHLIYHSLIILSVASTIIRTVPSLSDNAKKAIQVIELCFNITFTVEVFVRAACSPAKLAEVKNMYMWMDVLAVVPFWVLSFASLDARSNMYVELLTLSVPILRLLKITRHSMGWRLLLISLGQCLEPLCVPAFFLMLIAVFISCMLFWVESHAARCTTGDDCPKSDRPAFTSIPHAMWFSLVTMSTVGYGDVTPHTEAGKALTCGLVIAGVCYMAMPLAIMGSTFSAVWEDRDRIMLREKAASRFLCGGVKMGEMQHLWEMSDSDGDGVMELEEFVRLVDALQLGLTPVSLRQLFISIDTSGDGTVSFDEFISFLFPEISSEAEMALVRNTEGSTAGKRHRRSAVERSLSPRAASVIRDPVAVRRSLSPGAASVDEARDRRRDRDDARGAAEAERVLALLELVCAQRRRGFESLFERSERLGAALCGLLARVEGPEGGEEPSGYASPLRAAALGVPRAPSDSLRQPPDRSPPALPACPLDEAWT